MLAEKITNVEAVSPGSPPPHFSKVSMSDAHPTHPTLATATNAPPATHVCSQCRSEPIRSVSFFRDRMLSPVICFRGDLCWGCWQQRPTFRCLVCEGQFPTDNCVCDSCYTERGFMDTYQICHTCFFVHQMRYTDADIWAFREDFTIMQD